MPRAGLTTESVVRAGAEFADEVGIAAVTLAALAEQLGVRAPALYKHVDGLADLRHRIAMLAMTELGDALHDALHARGGVDALAAVITTVHTYIVEHPGRYSATTGAPLTDTRDPLYAASVRVIESLRSVVAEYDIAPENRDHAIRTVRSLIHGFASLQSADGFQWDNDVRESEAWMVQFVHAGLTAMKN